MNKPNPNKMNFIKEYWSQLTFLIFLIVGGTALHTEFKTLKQQVADEAKNQEKFEARIPQLINTAIGTLNEEDDGLRSDMERANESALELEKMRERALKAELMIEIIKNSKKQ